MTSNLPGPEARNPWFLLREKVLPTIIAAAMIGTFTVGAAMWQKLEIINVKIDDHREVQRDHENRIRSLERDKRP